jgi:hypothetical protein
MRAPFAPIFVSLWLPLWLTAATPSRAHADTSVSASTSASADTNRDELWFGGGGRALRSPSANALTDANLAGVSFGYARDLGITVLPDLAVWAEAGMATGGASGKMFQTLSTDLSTLGLTGGLRARYQLHRLVAASARLAFGAQRARVAITDTGGTSASDHGWGAMAQASAAIDLFAVARPPFGFGVRAELGYVAAQSIGLTARRDTSGDALMLPASEVPLGGLDLSGPAFAISFVGQF